MNYVQYAPGSHTLYLTQRSKGNYKIQVVDRAQNKLVHVFFAQSYKRGEWTLYNLQGVQVMRDATMQALINVLLHSPLSYHQELTDKVHV